jgi:hypothetical protein
VLRFRALLAALGQAPSRGLEHLAPTTFLLLLLLMPMRSFTGRFRSMMVGFSIETRRRSLFEETYYIIVRRVCVCRER